MSVAVGQPQSKYSHGHGTVGDEVVVLVLVSVVGPKVVVVLVHGTPSSGGSQPSGHETQHPGWPTTRVGTPSQQQSISEQL